jgi:hypothetical protein
MTDVDASAIIHKLAAKVAELTANVAFLEVALEQVSKDATDSTVVEE